MALVHMCACTHARTHARTPITTNKKTLPQTVVCERDVSLHESAGSLGDRCHVNTAVKLNEKAVHPGCSGQWTYFKHTLSILSSAQSSPVYHSSCSIQPISDLHECTGTPCYAWSLKPRAHHLNHAVLSNDSSAYLHCTYWYK